MKHFPSDTNDVLKPSGKNHQISGKEVVLSAPKSGYHNSEYDENYDSNESDDIDRGEFFKIYFSLSHSHSLLKIYNKKKSRCQ
jgi:hypothetical protein